MRIVFMGTPDFAVPTLETLVASEHEVVAVVTKPDKPKGRSGKLVFTPVKECANSHGITVYQPEKVKEEAFLAKMKEISPDIIVVVAFGQILPPALLDIPPFGCVNVHASLLPKYRGAAPIQWAVIDGEKETGVSIMYMSEGLDMGDVLDTKVFTLSKEETGGSLFDKLSKEGGPLLLHTLKGIEENTIVPAPQEEEKSTYAKMLKKEMGKLDFTKSAVSLECFIRGMNPWPSAYTYMNGKMLKIWKAQVIEEDSSLSAGAITKVEKDSIYIQTEKGQLKILELQLEGKKRMETAAFLLGYQVQPGTILGEKDGE